MPTYRPKPKATIMEAWQLAGPLEIVIGGRHEHGQKGDYLVRNSIGGLSIMPPDVFETQYEPIPPQSVFRGGWVSDDLSPNRILPWNNTTTTEVKIP